MVYEHFSDDEPNPRAQYYTGPGYQVGTSELPYEASQPIDGRHASRRGGRSYPEPGDYELDRVDDYQALSADQIARNRQARREIADNRRSALLDRLLEEAGGNPTTSQALVRKHDEERARHF